MAVVYIIYSTSLDRFYIGSCMDLKRRLIEHNNKYLNSFTSRSNDWQLFFAIENLGYEQSRLIEAHIKSMKSSIYVKNLKRYPEMVDKLIRKFE